MPKSPKELIYEVENEVLQEVSPWEYDSVEGQVKSAFYADGVIAMATALIRKLESNNAEEQPI